MSDRIAAVLIGIAALLFLGIGVWGTVAHPESKGAGFIVVAPVTLLLISISRSLWVAP